jgi:hypothetical protein
VLSLAVSHSWPVHQLDIKNTFLHGTLSETVYCSQPVGFVDPTQPERVCRLNKSLYGLKQAPRAWYNRFATYLLTLWFVEAKSDTSLFVFHRGADMVYLLLYADDIVLTASSTTLLQHTISTLKREFTMKDLGPLHHFWGSPYNIWLIDSSSFSASSPPVADPTQFRSLVEGLQYLTFTRPDIAYAVQQICLHMHDPWEPHLAAMKHVLRYMRGSLDFGLHLWRSASSSELTVYMDADWADCPDTRRSTSSYVVFLDDNLVSWSSKHQNIISRSSTEAEYRIVANGMAEACWLYQLLQELHAPLSKSTLVYCDNINVVYLSTNPVQQQRTKHIEIDLHFIRECVAIGDVRVLHVLTTSQFTDIFTKGLSTSVFLEFRSSLNIHRD